jgi:phosphopantetheinyl transferase
MRRLGKLRLAIASDSGQQLGYGDLTPAERRYSEQLATERQRRHLVLGRLAARTAIRQLIGFRSRTPFIEIQSESEHAPRVFVDGNTNRIAVSISHSSQLAAACAWPCDDHRLLFAGVDLEHIRPNDVAESTYAFSRQERRLLASLPEGPEILGLAAWTAKEAVWKALLAPQYVGPDALEIQTLSLSEQCAVVQVRGQLAERLCGARLQVQTKVLEGPDGKYVMSLAQVGKSR